MQERRGSFRNALLQQQGNGLKLRLGLEASLHRPVQQHAGQGQQAHALVVGHKRANDHRTLPARQAGDGVVDGLVQAKAPGQSIRGQALQVTAGGLGRHHHGQCRGVGRHHQVVAEAAFESQPRHTEGPVLIIEVPIHHVVSGLGHAPGQAQLIAVFDLPGHGGAAGLL